MPESLEIRVVVFQDGGLWVAQGLEYDIGAQAADLDTLYARFVEALKAEVELSLELRGEPLACIDAAPNRFHEMWERRAGMF